MEEAEKTFTSDEPLPGWKRIEVEGKKTWYKSPIPRTIIRNNRMLMEYLTKEHRHNRLLEVDGSEFSFKRRYGLKIQQRPMEKDDCEITVQGEEVSASGDNQAVEKVMESSLQSAVNRMVKVKNDINHRKMLSQCAKEIDSARTHDSYETPPEFDSLKEKLFSFHFNFWGHPQNIFEGSSFAFYRAFLCENL